MCNLFGACNFIKMYGGAPEMWTYQEIIVHELSGA
jgi:hypothetical protein